MNALNYYLEAGIVYFKSKDIVSLDDMKGIIDYAIEDDELPRELLVLEDARHATATFGKDDLETMVGYLKEKLSSRFVSIRHAVLHHSPLYTAFSYIVIHKFNDEFYSLNVFSSEKAALKWLRK